MEVISSLEEAVVEIGLRLEDVTARKAQPYPLVEQTVRRVLERVKSCRDVMVGMLEQSKIECAAEARGALSPVEGNA